MFDIPFNRPFSAGKELEYIQQALANMHISGDGPFTRKCSALLEQTLGVPKVLLTTSCTDALEMASLLLDVGEMDRATAVLQSRWPVSANGQWLAVTVGRAETPELVQMLVGQNVAIYEIRHQQQSLEQFFLDVTGETVKVTLC